MATSVVRVAGIVPLLNADAMQCLRRVLQPEMDARGHSLRDLVELSSCVPPGEVVTIDFVSLRELGQPLIVLRRGTAGATSPDAISTSRGTDDHVSVDRRLPHDSFQSLTHREREVVALIAVGLRNREIASRLVVTVGTVKDHVHHVLAKTGLPNRAAVGAAWAAEDFAASARAIGETTR